MTRQIFISYRRDDSAYAAGRLYDRLSQYFGASNVFMDIDAIELGVNFRKKIERAVGNCDILIAIIGKQWLSIKNKHGQRRLDEPNDFVRLEIQAALKRDIHVIPVLIDGASMPSTNELPREIAALSGQNGLEIRHAQFNDDANRLIRGLESIFEQIHRQTKSPVPSSDGKQRKEQDGSPNRLASAFGFAIIGVLCGLLLGGLATTISGYSDSSWWTAALITNVLGGAIIGLIGTKSWIPILTGMFVGALAVLGFYAIGGEPMDDAVASALVLGCVPGGLLGAIADKIRSR